MANLVKKEFILKHGNTPLPDLVLHRIAKKFLSEKDCLALALSGVSKRFAELFGTNRYKAAIQNASLFQVMILFILYYRKLVISRFQPLRLNDWNRFIGNITPLAVTIFDASHCYWLPKRYPL